ncbi:hypothetical protein [Nonomuraea sp. NPDC001023]|uniref:hypothetical protein n=1 Tax=unclassified Nonomuraea TaxID=2593643 RepID=UPI00331AD6BA
MEIVVRVFAGIGALFTFGCAFLIGWCLVAWRQEVKHRGPFPNSDLPAIPPAEYAAMHQDFERLDLRGVHDVFEEDR